jgi:amino acid transporter
MNSKDAKLSKSAIGSIESAIMGIGCTAPAFSIAVTSATIVGDVGTLAVGSVIYCGLIMFGLVFAFSNLNRFLPSAGASYTWVSRIFSPFLGFMAGWSMLLASVVFMVAATIPAASSTLLIFAPSLADNIRATACIAVLWLTIITMVVIKGIKNAYAAQLLMTIIELFIVAIIVGGTVYYFIHAPAHQLSLAWVSPFAFSFKSFATGAITALFFYWGWDVTMTLGEETKDGEAGSGAFLAVLNLMIFFSVMMAIVLVALSDNEIIASNSNVLFAIANKLFPAPWGYIGVMCTMLSTVGTIEGQIIQFSRCVFAMARDGALPSQFSRVHAKWQTPWVATILIWALGVIFVIGSSFLPSINDILKSSISAIGIQITLYMSLAGIASIWHYRHMLFSGVRNACFYILFPLAGTTGMIVIGMISIPQLNPVSLIVSSSGILLGVCMYAIMARLKE